VYNAATYVHNRTPTRTLGDRTPNEVLYGVKRDVLHLCAFGAPCAIVELKERLRKLEDRATMCFFVGYKYDGGGYRVWDPKRRVVAESRDCFLNFEDSLPSPTLNDLPPRSVDEDESVTQPALDHRVSSRRRRQTLPMRPPSAATPTALPKVTH